MGRRNTFFLCISSRNCIIIIIIIIVFVVVVMIIQNRQVIVTSLGCCWYSGDFPQISSLVDSGFAIEDVCKDGM